MCPHHLDNGVQIGSDLAAGPCHTQAGDNVQKALRRPGNRGDTVRRGGGHQRNHALPPAKAEAMLLMEVLPSVPRDGSNVLIAASGDGNDDDLIPAHRGGQLHGVGRGVGGLDSRDSPLHAAKVLKGVHRPLVANQPGGFVLNKVAKTPMALDPPPTQVMTGQFPVERRVVLVEIICLDGLALLTQRFQLLRGSFALFAATRSRV